MISPRLSSSRISTSYWAGLVNGTTRLFRNAPFAAARINVTPPISILSTALRTFTGSLLTTSRNGYKFTTTKSTGSMTFSCRYFACTGSFQSPRIPAWILGWRVFTSPPGISGNPVYVETSTTSCLSFRIAWAVPPELITLILCLANAPTTCSSLDLS